MILNVHLFSFGKCKQTYIIQTPEYTQNITIPQKFPQAPPVNPCPNL